MNRTTTTRTIDATARTTRGKNEARRLRASGHIPANLMGQGQSTPISINAKDFERLLASGLRASSKIELNVAGAKQEVLAKDVLRHPVSGQVLHVDFFKTTPGQKFRLKVPVELKGFSRGVKAGGALEHYVRFLDVNTDPQSVIENIEVDVTDLGVGDAIHVEDLKLPSSWDMRHSGNPVICRVAESRVSSKAGEGKEGG